MKINITLQTNKRRCIETHKIVLGNYQQKYNDKLEMTQCRAARFVKNVPEQRNKLLTLVSAALSDLGWESLQTPPQIVIAVQCISGAF